MFPKYVVIMHLCNCLMICDSLYVLDEVFAVSEWVCLLADNDLLRLVGSW